MIHINIQYCFYLSPSLENGVHHITEEEKICCAVETEEIQAYVANLKCYIESKKTSSIYEIPDDITPG